MIELIMCEVGNKRGNAGDSNLNKFNRLDPAYTTMKKYFPDLKVTFYTDMNTKINIPSDVIVIRRKSPYNPKHARYGWRTNALFQVTGLLESNADVAITLDSDMFVFSEDVKHIEKLTKRFGICLPMNPRSMIKVDTRGMDSDRQLDETNGTGHAINLAILSFHTKNDKARRLLEDFVKRQTAGFNRSTITMWRCIWQNKEEFNPYMLPVQWCLCAGQEGMGNEVILHIGHKAVKDYYESKGLL